MVGFARWQAAGALALGIVSASCGYGHSCTDIGCEDSLSVTIASRSGEWRSGDYELMMEFDDREESCTFNVPEDLVDPRSVTFDCSSRRMSPRLTSTPEGRFELSFALSGAAPQNVTTQLSRDGSSTLNDSQPVSYQTLQPNEDCGPICKRGQLELEAD